MSTKHAGLFASLTEPFGDGDVRSRPSKNGPIHYITARTVMNRLDDVLGPENWWDVYTEHEKSVVCRLTIVMPDGKEVSKEDAGGFAGMDEEDNDTKSGYSDAFKRAAVKFGIGRHLYGSGMVSYGNTPAVAPEPARAPTTRPEPPRTTTPAQARSASQVNFDNFKIPRAGKQVYAWAKGMEDHYQLGSNGLVAGMADEGKKQNWGGSFVAWTQDQVDHVCGTAIAYIRTLDNYKGEFDTLGPQASVDANAPAASVPQTAPPSLKKEILALAAQVFERQNETQAEPADVRKVVEEVSSSVANASGHVGECLDSLSGCRDGIWLKNILEALDSFLKVTDTATTPGSVDDDEDIPF